MGSRSTSTSNNRQRTIVFAALNWGLGHATRIVPLVEEALRGNNRVILASDGRALEYLRMCFPGVETVELPPLTIRYSKGNSLFLALIAQLPAIICWIFRDNKAARRLVEREQPDMIISDNRWGFSVPGVKSVFMTHQVSIKLPFRSRVFERIAFSFQQVLLGGFSEIWIPDYEDRTKNLSGDLSHRFTPNKIIKYIGILSRFHKPPNSQTSFDFDVAVILSGPEPQKSILENLVLESMIPTKLRAAIIGAHPGNTRGITPLFHFYPNPAAMEMQDVLNKSKIVICRSGYSSIMDMVRMQKRCVMVPTPGQTEQLYLGELLASKKWFRRVFQEDFSRLDLSALLEDNEYQPPPEFFFEQPPADVL